MTTAPFSNRSALPSDGASTSAAQIPRPASKFATAYRGWSTRRERPSTAGRAPGICNFVGQFTTAVSRRSGAGSSPVSTTSNPQRPDAARPASSPRRSPRTSRSSNTSCPSPRNYAPARLTSRSPGSEYTALPPHPHVVGPEFVGSRPTKSSDSGPGPSRVPDAASGETQHVGHRTLAPGPLR
jgi:hypothetical protein